MIGYRFTVYYKSGSLEKKEFMEKKRFETMFVYYANHKEVERVKLGWPENN